MLSILPEDWTELSEDQIPPKPDYPVVDENGCILVGVYLVPDADGGSPSWLAFYSGYGYPKEKTIL